ncbi:hypothetical protein [Yinghuangia soli]|uniref:Uncharacterized protein n=1 Tax=Yinghuangia soli TaxID=2908204 RepID=A0AA41Q5V6_9ACTN|nr:hypothetical protein [Yinghuangia soli]MCF2530934.1 hypothetical protein [Yinghuangia soli]
MALSQVVLDSGRTVALSELRMSSTYGGMLEGYPFRRWNDMKLDALVTRTKAAHSAPVHVVEPTRVNPDGFVGAFGPMERFPAVTCTGTFYSRPVDQGLDQPLYRSHLVIVWFQDSLDAPTKATATPGLQATPWDALATDHEL